MLFRLSKTAAIRALSQVPYTSASSLRHRRLNHLLDLRTHLHRNRVAISEEVPHGTRRSELVRAGHTAYKPEPIYGARMRVLF